MATKNPGPQPQREERADFTEETVTISAVALRDLMARLETLERTEAIRREHEERRHVLDDSFEAWKKEAGRPASERTQDMADKKYGKDGQRFRVRLDSKTEDGKPGPRIEEHFPLVLSANSDLEAQGRYLEIMGIKKHDYRIVVEPVAA